MTIWITSGLFARDRKGYDVVALDVPDEVAAKFREIGGALYGRVAREHAIHFTGRDPFLGYDVTCYRTEAAALVAVKRETERQLRRSLKATEMLTAKRLRLRKEGLRRARTLAEIKRDKPAPKLRPERNPSGCPFTTRKGKPCTLPIVEDGRCNVHQWVTVVPERRGGEG